MQDVTLNSADRKALRDILFRIFAVDSYDIPEAEADIIKLFNNRNGGNVVPLFKRED